MDLAKMRSRGVWSIFVICDFGRPANVDVSGLTGAIEVPALRWRLRCSAYEVRSADVRPNWREHRAHGLAC